MSPDALQAWVGRERLVEDELHPFHAQGLANALDCQAIPGSGDALPPGWQWMYFLDTPRATATGKDGHAIQEQNSFLPPIHLPRRMWAAGRMEMHSPLALGAVAQRRSVIRSIQSKHGKSGELVFVVIEHQYHQGGQVRLTETQDLVYREMPNGPAPLPAGEIASENAEFSRDVQPDPVLLFRYSALTFNGHRIHYDRNYAMDTEFYPALVVHGPLLATLLLELAAENLPDGKHIRAFEFRAVRPSFDVNPLKLCGRLERDRMDLWSSDHEGFLCVRASAVIS